jgi:hypothetical protein
VTKERLGRIKKLLALREHTLQRAQSAFATAQHEAARRREIAVAEAEHWLGTVERANALREATVDDFVTVRGDVLAARARVEGCERELVTAIAARDSSKQNLTEAHRRVREMELYAEATHETLRQEERAFDRILSDEIAARLRRT